MPFETEGGDRAPFSLVFQTRKKITKPTSGKTATHGALTFKAMTRWARANNVHKHKAAEATPWSQLRASGAPKGGGEPQRNHARGTQPSGSAVKKANRKKKDYTDQDVNGFLEFLQQNGQTTTADGQEELRQEVEGALRKDQRRENRRLKRQTDKKSKMLCFNCRKPGHGLADCPDAERDREMGRGICYRCGSTEHEIQRCRAKVDPAVGDFPYAKCFICSQTGHLSRSCPDNPKGLYAQGGSCRVCGSVEHFQKDCPEHQASSQSVTLGWLSNNMSADHEDVHVPVTKSKPERGKVVVF
ncbi:zinc finger CCHC domain-containing protein 9 isoform X2 [Phyllopteryx taeniolatus]|uniref:zinc finger CCHC domain-containing protein 9 isoform X2 n=1 Tax=Phyllopteryx taeniolatus TaxID=161469 RepID=UPI002AD2259E|nr:zinc finger CCHC domain-containing protein 9 isoform X2 [Phyllopteryx taeniolatus]